VRAQLSISRELTASTIPELITKHAEGVFIWAYLVVDRILGLNNTGAGLREIKDEIYSIPPELDDLYHNLIRNMDERPASLKLIQWICFSVRPLSLDELRWAMIIDADCPYKSLQECENTKDYISDSDRMKRRVQTLSCGLIEVTSDTKVIQFIHQSVKDFFTEKGLSALDETANPDFIVEIAHYRLSRICIRYLAMEEIGQSASYIPSPYYLNFEFPFLYYATTSWVTHIKQSDGRSAPQEDLLEYFIGPSNTLMERWVRIYGLLERYSDDCPPKGISLVYVMSRYGVAGALGVILGRADQVGINIDGGDSDGRTPLWWAVERGHEAVVQLLLDRGAYTEAADKEGWTPLLRAAENGHEAVMRLLLDRVADIEAADKDGQTPLSKAALIGHKDIMPLRSQTLLWSVAERVYEAVGRLLLDRGADTDVANMDGQTPLLSAAFKEQKAIILLRGRTPLLTAASKGHKNIVRLLLDRGVDINAADEWGRTPLWWAVERGHEAVVRLLLDRGADTDAAGKDGQTPLCLAAERGDEAVMRLLLDRVADIEAADKDGLTPLSKAALIGHKDIMPLRSQTLLWWAVERGHEAVGRLLLDRGADTDVANMDGQTPLCLAAERGDEAVMRLLLDRGAETNAVDKDGRTPLSWATKRGDAAVVRLLLDRNAYTEAADRDGRTPLWWAASKGHKAIVRLLVDWDASVKAVDKNGRTPLSTAALEGHEAIVRLLLNRGADINAADEWGRTPLFKAALKGHEAVVRLLLDRGADINAADKDGQTPLLTASAWGHKATVRVLLDRDADTNAADKWGQTPLSWAAKRGHEAVVRLLLNRGVCTEAADKDG
jgi:ankyrin repeat protein